MEVFRYLRMFMITTLVLLLKAKFAIHTYDPHSFIYTQQQKKRENSLLLNWLKINYVEFKKNILHVKLTECILYSQFYM